MTLVADAQLMVFYGNANKPLAESVITLLDIDKGEASVGKFSDGEINVKILENVRGSDVFVVQPTCKPTNDHLMELLVIIDALKRASVFRVTAVIPYYGYARQDRRPRSARVPISAKLIANMISAVGCDRILTIDLHSDQIQGFFDIPVDNIYATNVMVEDIQSQNISNVMVVSPDTGGVVRARALATHLNSNTELAIIDKRRPKANVSEVMNVIGDVTNADCIMVDDIVDTGGTMCKAAVALKENGAKSVRAYCTHAVLSGPAVDNFNNSVIDELVVCDTIPLSKKAKDSSKIRQISIAKLLAQSISNIHSEKSVSSLFY